MTTERGHRRLPRRAMLARIQPILVGHLVDLAPLPTTSHDNDQVQVDPSLAQQGLRQLRGSGSNLGQTTRRRGHGGRPRRSRPSQPWGCRPTATPYDLIPVGHNGRRRPDTGHLDAPDARTGHRSPGQAPRDTEHRTPDTGHESGHGDDSTAGVRTSLAATPSDRTLRRPTVFALSHYQPAPRPLRRPSSTPAHCCPRTISGRA